MIGDGKMYCMSIDQILDAIVGDEEIVLYRSTASDRLGLSRGWGIPIHFYTEDDKMISSSYLRPKYVADISSIESIECGGRLCTDHEMTVCDVLLYEEDTQTVLECLAGYYYRNGGDTSGLMAVAEKLGVERKIDVCLDKYYEDAISYYDE